jgi:hypothetical protein
MHNWYWWRNIKRQFVRPRRRLNDGIKMDFQELAWEVVDRFRLGQNMDKWWALAKGLLS